MGKVPVIPGNSLGLSGITIPGAVPSVTSVSVTQTSIISIRDDGQQITTPLPALSDVTQYGNIVDDGGRQVWEIQFPGSNGLSRIGVGSSDFARNFSVATNGDFVALTYSGERYTEILNSQGVLDGYSRGASVLQLYDYNGEKVGNEIIFTDQTNQGGRPGVHAINEDIFALFWQTNNPNGLESHQPDRTQYTVGRLFDVSSETFGDTFVIDGYSNLIVEGTTIDLAKDSTGKIYATWTEYDLLENPPRSDVTFDVVAEITSFLVDGSGNPLTLIDSAWSVITPFDDPNTLANPYNDYGIQRILIRYVDQASNIVSLPDHAINFAVTGSNAVTASTTGGSLSTLPQSLNFDYVDLGSVTYDHGVNISDAVGVLKYIVGLQTLGDTQALAADANMDGRIDISDAVRVLKHIVGLDPIEACTLLDTGGNEVSSTGPTLHAEYTIIQRGDVDLSATFEIV